MAGHTGKRKPHIGPSFRILVVDDDPAVHEAVRDALRSDFAVVSCATAAEAMHADARGFDVAIVDYRLPDGPGLDVVKRLAAATPRVPSVFVTGFGTFALAREALERGAVALLEKPFSAADVVKTVYRAVGERPVPAPQADIARDDRLRAVVSFLEARIYTGVREKELLAELGFSRTAFHRFFTERFGVSFREYVGTERLRAAKYLLAATRLPVSEIASRMGLLNPGYFAAWFRRQTGMPPLQYRTDASA